MSELYRQAVALLTTREHTRQELARKLKRSCKNDEDVQETLDLLEQADILSDRRFAESFIRSYRDKWGNGRLTREMVHRGVADYLAAEVMTAQECDDESERAYTVLCKKHPNPVVGDYKLEASCRRFLEYRGFADEAIRQALSRHLTEVGRVPDGTRR